MEFGVHFLEFCFGFLTLVVILSFFWPYGTIFKVGVGSEKFLGLHYRPLTFI